MKITILLLILGLAVGTFSAAVQVDVQLNVDTAMDRLNQEDTLVNGKIHATSREERFLQTLKKTAGHNVGIIGGTVAAPHAWPWQVEIKISNGQFICGGSILSNRWIMTAAHCCEFMSPSPSNYRVRVGVHSRSATNEGAVLMNLVKLVIHPKWDSRRINNDFCLLKTATKISLNKNVSVIAIASPRDVSVGKKCWVTGWGETRIGGNNSPGLRSSSDKLLQADVNIISNTACNKIYQSITNSMVCAIAPGHGTCNGDSGGPLVCQNGAEPYKLVGVVSFGRQGCNPKYPGVYARPSTVLSWITSTIAT